MSAPLPSRSSTYTLSEQVVAEKAEDVQGGSDNQIRDGRKSQVDVGGTKEEV